jgi:hypothetical protein
MVKSQDWLGRSEKNVAALEDQLREVWNLGRNVVLQWSQLDDSIQILAVPQYLIASHDIHSDDEHQEFVRRLLTGDQY